MTSMDYLYCLHPIVYHDWWYFGRQHTLFCCVDSQNTTNHESQQDANSKVKENENNICCMIVMHGDYDCRL